jgi:hypothetical protein
VPGIPALVLCDGDAIVHGTLSVSVEGALTNTSPAGWVRTGEGYPGSECTSQISPGWYSPPGGGLHAGTYGSVVPFSLDGGSSGGIMLHYRDLGSFACGQGLQWSQGGRPGGTLALLARGRIEVSGTVTADGNGGYSGGSGGSILLRGDAGVSVLPGGTVTARGGRWMLTPPDRSIGAPGYVRLDTWGATPDVQGTVAPVPTVLELPHLRTQSPPQIGTTWILDVFAPENAPIFVSASLQAGPGTATPFGILGIDAATAAGIALVVAQPSHDPMASVQWAVPNAPVLIGLALWVQAFAIPAALPPRLTNALAVVVG